MKRFFCTTSLLACFALALIAIPISFAIGVTLKTLDAPALTAASWQGRIETSAAPNGPVVPAMRISRRDAAALRASARRRAATPAVLLGTGSRRIDSTLGPGIGLRVRAGILARVLAGVLLARAILVRRPLAAHRTAPVAIRANQFGDDEGG